MFDDGELMERAGQIHALAAELAAGIDGQLSGPVAGMAVEEVFGALRQAELAACRLIERVDRSGEFSRDGFVSVSAYVRERAGESQGWASKRVHVGRALADRLPATAAAWEKGALGLEHAVVIDKATRELKDAGQVRVVDEALAGACPWASPHDLAGIAEQIRAATAPEAAADKADKQRMAAKLSLSKTLDGMWRLDGWLDPETGALVNQALGAFTDPTRTGGSGGAGQSEALAEPNALRRARALGEICRQAAGHAESCNGTGGGRHTMIITMDWEALRSGLGVGTVAGDRSTLPAGALRRLACDAAIIPAVLGGDGAILDFGRKTRLISPSLRAFLIARDGGCVFPGCDRPASWCDAHHRKAWHDGGCTDRDNLDLLCSKHHHLVHEGWYITIADDAGRTPWFHAPDGRAARPGQRRPLLRHPGQRGSGLPHPAK
jgi:hypothetical protein